MWSSTRSSQLSGQSGRTNNKEVFIQHDNATAHFGPDYLPFRTAGVAFGWNITLTGQPANSPDTNINDLGFFRALQSCQWDNVEEARDDKDGLILAVTEAFESFEPRLLDYTFLTLQTCLEQIILSHGDNIYAIPHMRKEHLEQEEMLPVRVKASSHAVEIAYSFLAGEDLEVLDADVVSSDDDEDKDASDGLSGNENEAEDGNDEDDEESNGDY
jgi:hypothetical protein